MPRCIHFTAQNVICVLQNISKKNTLSKLTRRGRSCGSLKKLPFGMRCLTLKEEEEPLRGKDVAVKTDRISTVNLKCFIAMVDVAAGSTKLSSRLFPPRCRKMREAYSTHTYICNTGVRVDNRGGGHKYVSNRKRTHFKEGTRRRSLALLLRGSPRLAAKRIAGALRSPLQTGERKRAGPKAYTSHRLGPAPHFYEHRRNVLLSLSKQKKQQHNSRKAKRTTTRRT